VRHARVGAFLARIIGPSAKDPPHVRSVLRRLFERDRRRERRANPEVALLELGHEVASQEREENDRVAGLRADDYLGKPFEQEELLARVDALGRRGKNRLTIGELVIDQASGRVALRGKRVDPTAREQSLLMRLAERVGQIVEARSFSSRSGA
jgi:DNA-binding response OmpR family regulator